MKLWTLNIPYECTKTNSFSMLVLVLFSHTMILFIATAKTSWEVWTTLATFIQSHLQEGSCRSRLKITNLVKGFENVTKYMQNIKRHVDELMALINSSIEAKDLMVKILSGLHEEYKDLAFAIQARENLILFSELHEKLFNFQARLRKEAAKHPLFPASTNPTTKLLQFNKKMACLNQTSLGNNLTIANPRHRLGEWTLPLLSTNAYHFQMAPWFQCLTPCHNGSLKSFIGWHYNWNDTNLPIMYTSSTKLLSSSKSSFVHVLCVPTMKKNLISVSKIYSTNNDFIEFLSISFHVRDFWTGVALLQGLTRDNGESYIIS